MKTVIYLDVLLLVNFLIAYFLLMATGLLTAQSGSFPRMLAASAVAACSALILFAPEMTYPMQILYKAGSAAAIVAVAFRAAHKRRYLTAVCWYTALNVLLAGLAILMILKTQSTILQTANLTVYLQISPILLLTLSALCWGLAEILVHFLHPPQQDSATLGMELELCGMVVRLRASLDTGCHLKDPITCLPVLLISYPDAKPRLPAAAVNYLDAWFAGQRSTPLPDELHLRLIPCMTASGQTLLPGLALPEIGLITKNGIIGTGRTAVAFSPQAFGDGEYEALYGNDFL